MISYDMNLCPGLKFTTYFDAMVGTHYCCVRGEGTINSSSLWLIRCDWIRDRDSYVRLVHRVCQPFFRRSEPLPRTSSSGHIITWYWQQCTFLRQSYVCTLVGSSRTRYVISRSINSYVYYSISKVSYSIPRACYVHPSKSTAQHSTELFPSTAPKPAESTYSSRESSQAQHPSQPKQPRILPHTPL